LANAAHPRIVHACDTWEGSGHEISSKIAEVRDVHATWSENVRLATQQNVVAHRMDWRDYVPTINEPVGLCFIDAEHSYKEVFDNVTQILPLMPPGGIVCGDDIHHEPVQQALVDLFHSADVYVNASVWWWVKPAEDDITQRHLDNCATPSDINLHLPRMVRLVEIFNAQHVVELGARSGLSTLAWLVGLGRTGGRLTSIDLAAAPSIGKHDNWTHIQGDDTDPDVMAQVDACDILFIDTSHHYDHTLWELRNWSHKVRNGGLIVCHDTELQRPWDPPCPETDPDFPVKSAIQVFVAERELEWINIPECWGLGIIEVVEAT
jgi:predicted O-methyltransferase YrrM